MRRVRGFAGGAAGDIRWRLRSRIGARPRCARPRLARVLFARMLLSPRPLAARALRSAGATARRALFTLRLRFAPPLGVGLARTLARCAWLGRGLVTRGSPALAAAAGRRTIPVAAAARARAAASLLAARAAGAVCLARALRRTAAATARATSLLAAALAAAAAILAGPLVGLADRATGTARHAHAERTRSDPQETALALLDRGDHGLGACEPQRLESLLHCLIVGLAFVHGTSHRIAFAERACVARRSPARER